MDDGLVLADLKHLLLLQICSDMTPSAGVHLFMNHVVIIVHMWTEAHPGAGGQAEGERPSQEELQRTSSYIFTHLLLLCDLGEV